jgi:hypothetical protein
MSNNNKHKKTSTKTLRGVLAPKVTHFSANRTVTDEDVAVRAYLIWQREGRPEGRHVEHWLAAEAELRA